LPILIDIFLSFLLNNSFNCETSLSCLFIYEAKGKQYPNSTNLHTIHHRPLFIGKAIAKAEIIKKGKNIVTIKGELYNNEGKLASTLIHSAMIMESDFKM